MTFGEYLSARGLTVTENESVLLTLADDFIESNIEFCTDPPPETLEKMRYKIAYSYSGNGGLFDDDELSTGKVTIKEGIGRNALVEESEIIDKSVLGNDSLSKIKRIGVYSLISKYLCGGQSVGLMVV